MRRRLLGSRLRVPSYLLGLRRPDGSLMEVVLFLEVLDPWVVKYFDQGNSLSGLVDQKLAH